MYLTNTHICEHGALVTRLVLVLFVRRSALYLIAVLLVFAVGTLKLEYLDLARGRVHPRPVRCAGFHLDAEGHALLASVLLRGELRADAVNLKINYRNSYRLLNQRL